MAFEYNKLRHTTHWSETDERAEWPLSENTKEEEPPRDSEAFDLQCPTTQILPGSQGPRRTGGKFYEGLLARCPLIHNS
jgi:hypothetical protein